jgi:hypothetical protein
MKNPIYLDPKNYAGTITSLKDERHAVGTVLENGDIVIASKYCPSGQYLVTVGVHFLFPESVQMGVVQ